MPEPGAPPETLAELTARAAVARLEDLARRGRREMTPAQTAFVAEYLVDLNASQASLRVGYGATWGSGQLSDPRVAEAVESAIAQRAARINVKQDDVLHEMSLLANSRINHYIVDDDGQVQLAEGAPDGAMAAIQSIKRKKTVRESKNGELFITYDVELRLWDKTVPLKLIGQHVGLFPGRVEVTGPNGGPIETITEVRRVVVRPQDEMPEDARPEAVH